MNYFLGFIFVMYNIYDSSNLKEYADDKLDKSTSSADGLGGLAMDSWFESDLEDGIEGTGTEVKGRRVYDALFSEYRPTIIPQCDEEPVRLEIDIALRQITSLVEKDQTLEANLWVRLTWTDCRLVWDPAAYDNITVIYVSYDDVWQPDFTLYDSASKGDHVFIGRKNYRSKITSDGRVSYNFPTVTTSSCGLDVQYFPFDTQTCALNFGSWSYSGLQLDIYSRGPTGDTTTYIESSEWILKGFKARKYSQYYNCCPEPYSVIIYELKITRRPDFYVVTIMAPCVLSVIAAGLAFALPMESGEKISLEITVLLSLSVFLLVVSETLPPSSNNFPILGTYFGVSMVIVMLSLFQTVMVLNMNHKGVHGRRVPRSVRVLFFDYLGRLVCVSKGFPPYGDRDRTDEISPVGKEGGVITMDKSTNTYLTENNGNPRNSTPITQGDTMNGTPITQGDTMNGTPITQGDTMNGTPIAQGDTMNGTPTTQGDTMNGTPITQGDTMNGTPITQGDTMNGTPLTQGDTMNGTPIAQGDTMNGTPITQCDTMNGTPITQCDTMNGTPITQCDTMNGTPITQCDTMNGTTITQCDTMNGTPITQCDTMSGTPITQCDTMNGTPITQCDTMNGTPITQGDTMSGTPIAQGDTMNGTPITQCDTMNGTPITQCDTMNGTPITQCDTMNGTTITQCDTMNGTPITQGDTMSGTPITQCDTMNGTPITQCDTMNGTPITQGDTMSGTPIVQGDTMSGTPIAQGDTMNGTPITQGDTMSGTPIAQGDTMNGTPTTQGDTMNGTPITQGDTMSGTPIAQGDTMNGTPTTQGDTMNGTPITQGDTMNGTPITQGDTMNGTPIAQGDTMNGTPITQGDTMNGTPTTQGDTMNGTPITQGDTMHEANTETINPRIKVMKHKKYVTESSESSLEEEHIMEEWRHLAHILDRLFLLIYVLISVVVTGIVYLQLLSHIDS